MKFYTGKGGCRCADCACRVYGQFFDTLGNQNRLHVLAALRKGPRNVSQIITQTGLEQTCVSHCLRRLEQLRFVTAKRKGKFRIYELNRTTVEPLITLIGTHVQRCTIGTRREARRRETA